VVGRGSILGVTDDVLKTYQGIVYPAQCDAMGHMTVQYYGAAFDQAMWNLVYALGWRSAAAPERTGFADVRHVIDYRAELAVGAPFAVESVPLRCGRTSIIMSHRMYDVVNQTLAAEMEMTSVHFDLVNRVAIPLPEAFRQLVCARAGGRISVD
jgi:acyl-CoA thioester hydrolase